MDQIVNGNVYILGNNVTITGEVSGNLFICAKNVNFEEASYIEGSTYIVSNNINFNSLTSSSGIGFVSAKHVVAIDNIIASKQAITMLFSLFIGIPPKIILIKIYINQICLSTKIKICFLAYIFYKNL